MDHRKSHKTDAGALAASTSKAFTFSGFILGTANITSNALQ